MNFIKFLFKFRIFFFLCLLFGTYSLSGASSSLTIEKEILSIEFKLPLHDFKGEIIDYCFDNLGALYVSSNNKIGIYRGQNWEYIGLIGKSIFSVSSSGGIFIANGSKVFSLKLDSALNYFLEPLTEIQNQFGNGIKQIISINDIILLNAGKIVFKWSENELQELFRSDNEILIHKTTKRVVFYSDGKYAMFSPVNGIGNFIAFPNKLAFLQDHPQGFIAYCESDHSLRVVSPSFRQIKQIPLKGSHLVGLISLADSSFAVINEEQHLSLISTDGSFLLSQKTSALASKPILKISPYGRIWLSSRDGFIIFDITSKLLQIKCPVENGKINWIGLYQGRICVATPSGLYDMETGKIVHNENWQYFQDTPYGLLGLSYGLVRQFVNGGIENLADSCLIIQWDEHSESLYILRNGIIEIQSFNPVPLRREYRENLDPYISDFCTIDSTVYCLSEKQIFCIQEHKIIDTIDFPAETIYSDVYDIQASGKNIFLFSSKGIFRYNFTKAVFEKQYGLSKSIHCYNSDWVIYPGPFELSLEKNDQNVKYLWLPRSSLTARDISIYYLNDNELLISRDENLFLYNKNSKYIPEKLSVQITKLRINSIERFSNTDFEIAKVFLRNELNSIPHKNNSIEIHFNSSDFISPPGLYSFTLNGGKSEFKSGWIPGDHLILENLRAGRYNLKLVLKNDDGIQSEEFNLPFSIISTFWLRWYAWIFYFLILGAGTFILYRLYMIRKHNIRLKVEEKIKVEAFHKAEPEQFIEENKQQFDSNINSPVKKSKWDKYDMVTVLFSDIQGFTKIAESMNPERLIDELDHFFFHFDSVVDKYNIEKIKTIGDAYMAAGGIPKRNNTNPVEVVLAALEMQHYMRHLKQTKVDIWDLRIGIHTGPVIGGKIGSKKRSFDIWGDSVNIASRMESSGEPGKVNISGETYSLVKEFFICDYRGKIPVKYKGNLDMYFVRGLRPELSINLIGLPNRKFFLNLQLLRLLDLEDFVFGKMEAENPKGLYFHTVEYSQQVYDHAHLLAKSENLDPEETLLVRTASLFLHLGYISNYENPEVESAEISRNILSEFQYSERQINSISNLILSTRQPFEPMNIMEMILADSCMQYLGRSDFIKIYKFLFLEENEMGKAVDPRVWKANQIKILENFKYFTNGARRLNEISFKKQIQNIEEDPL